MNHVRFLFLFFILCVNSLLKAPPMPLGVNTATQGLSPAEAALNDQEQMFLKEISNMNEEQRMQLWNSIVSEVEKEAQKLPEAEREKFLNSFWNEVAQEAEKLEQKIQNTPGFQPTPEPEKIPEVIKPEVKPEAPKPQGAKPVAKPTTDKIEALKKTIEGILSRLSSFMTKTAIIPDMPTRMMELKKQGFVPQAPKDFSWATFKRDIEKFTQQLHTLLDKDPKTKQPKYLAAVEEGLRNNLTQLHTKLSTYEPKIETTDFAQTRLGKESKNAFNFVVNTVSEAFYVLSVPQELDKVFGVYEPRKQELLKQKETLEKEALRPAGPTQVRPISQAGIPTPERAGSAPAPYKFQAPTSGGGHDFGPMGGGFDRGAGAGYGGGAPFGGDAGAGAPSKGGMAAPELKAPPAPSEKPEKSTQGAKERALPTPSKEAAKKEEDKKSKDKKGDDTLKELFKMVRDSFYNLHETLSESLLKNLEHHVTTAGPVNLRTAQAVEAATKEARRAANRVSQWRLKVRRSEEAIIKVSKEDAEDLLELHGKIIQDMINQIRTIKAQEQTISADKKYAFIDQAVNPTTQTLLTTLPTPPSVYELSEALTQVLNDLRNASAGR